MLRGAALILQLTLWIVTVHAFFPFIPDDQCDPGEHCGPFSSDSKRSHDGSAQISEGVTLDLVSLPRSPNVNSNAATENIAQAIERVKGKNGGWPSISHSHPGQPGLGKRVNNYQVSEPIAPTAADSAGIYQYGPDYSYFIKVLIGSAQQPFYMLLDTGAANSWVMGSDCESDACKMHNVLDPASSKTWRSENKGFSISYGTGDVAGIVGQDTMSFAGFSVDLSLGLANYTHNDFRHFAFDGILGLAMSASVSGTFMQTLKQKKLLKSLVFSISLNRDSDGRNDGQITFGGIDRAKYTGEISYTDVPPPNKDAGEWVIPLGGLSVNGQSAAVSNRLAYIDTGTSFVFAPPDDLAALFKLIPGSSSSESNGYVEYTVPCDTKHPITITFSNVAYEISPADWIVKTNDHCVSRLYGYEFKAGTWLLGDAFLKNVYSVFDAENMRIGFASKPASPTNSASSSAVASATAVPTVVTTDGSARPVMPGISGQETASNSAVAGTATATTSPAQVALGDQLKSSTYLSVLCVAAALAVMV